MTECEKAYVAGFLDGDGCLLAQIVKSPNYKFGFRIRVSIIFYQKTKRHWFILWLKKKFQRGSVRKRKDGVSEYTITGYTPVREVLILLRPYIFMKKPLVALVLKIIDQVQTVSTQEGFLEVCENVDKTAQFTDSKKRKNTAQVVQDH